MDEISISSKHDLKRYEWLLSKAPEATIDHCTRYVDLIASLLKARPFYLGVQQDDKLLGAIPAVLKENSKFGNIINSSPYFGSHGGFIVDPDLTPEEKGRTKRALLEFFNRFAKEQECILSVIISSPFDHDQHFYFENVRYDYLDRRVAQVVTIPQVGRGELRQTLFRNRFGSSCRRSIRKAIALGVTVSEIASKGKELDKFYETYREGMEAKGGQVKSKEFFEKALETFPAGFCKLRYALLRGEVIAGIFHFYFNEIAEYYQPALSKDFRNTAATNLLILDGMLDAAAMGYLYWNFGGTWMSQERLHRFKRSFGAVDYSYYYYITVYRGITDIKKSSPATLQSEYPNFYVLPYSQLANP